MRKIIYIPYLDPDPGLKKVSSVSDPHSLNTDPNPGLWLNTDAGSQYLILLQQKNIFNRPG